MNSDRIEELGTQPIRDLLSAVREARSVPQLFELGARMAREGVRGPLGVDVSPDFAESTRYSTTLLPAGLTLRGSAFYLDEGEELEEVRAAFPRYVATLFEVAGLEEATEGAQAVLELETKLAELHRPAEQLRDIGRYNPYPVADLEQLSPGIDWPAYLAAAGLRDQTRIILGSPSYVEGLDSLLRSEPLDTWKDYWTLRVLDAHAEFLGKEFVDARFEFVDRLSLGISAMPPRSARATRRIKENLDWPLAKLYVDRHFSPEAKEYLNGLIDNLIEAFERAIDGAEWVGDETRAKAHEKLAKIERRIGHPETWPDYSALRISSEDLVGNVRRVHAFVYDAAIEKLSRPVKSDELFSVPLWVTGTYVQTSNAIEFTAPLLQPPLFVMGADDAYNYAAIGQVIGHELGHGFDDEGRRFDGDGNLADWWTEEDGRAYQERADRLVAYYSEFEPLDGFRVNGERTLGENIADLTALVLGYDAYLASLAGEEPPVIDGFTGKQRYFLSYAQAWRNKLRDETLRQWILFSQPSPPKVRVNGPLKHFPEFYEAFEVKPGDAMWLPPDERVRIW
jgi:predicted metalloendopeptidase